MGPRVRADQKRDMILNKMICIYTFTYRIIYYRIDLTPTVIFLTTKKPIMALAIFTWLKVLAQNHTEPGSIDC